MAQAGCGTARLVGRETSRLAGPEGLIEFVTTGSGLPATVFAHGLTGSIETTRPFGSGVKGSRTFFHFRGHGGTASPKTPWTYAALADELRAVADHVGATQALGVSMGAGALCALLVRAPLRFDRLVFVMPAVLDRPRTDEAMGRLAEMAQHVEDGDLQAVSTLRALTTAVPLTDRAVLAAVAVPALVVAQEQDAAHPVWVAEQLAALLPKAHLVVLPAGGILCRHRGAMRELLGGFLSGEPRQ